MIRGLLPFALAALAAGPAQAERVTLGANRDNTLFEPFANEVTSSGAGPALFAGLIATVKIRRALLRFDTSLVPTGAQVDSVHVVLHVTRFPEQSPGPFAFSLHRVLADWGEGTSNSGGDAGEFHGGQGALAAAGDATWSFRRFDADLWSVPGGDFEASPLATAQVAGNGAYTWASTPALVQSVQAWVDGQPNFGWLLAGGESSRQSARRFASREASDPGLRPVLVVDFTPTAVEPSTWAAIKAFYRP